MSNGANGTDLPSLLELFRATASEVVEKDMSHVVSTSLIGELCSDSLAVLEIIGSMERALHIHIPDEALTGVESVADLLGVVRGRIQQRAQS